jgi:hypothetical protein
MLVNPQGMITNVKTITCEHPHQEIWKRLRYLLDENVAIEKILENHPSAKKNANIKKQAQQIGFCVQQAEDYFKASSQVKLATRPLLMYYGAVCLSKAVVLLKNNGEYSIDYLRKNNKHQQHGLNLIKTLTSKSIKNGDFKNFLENITCEVNTKVEEGNTIGWGHFPLFYKSLSPGLLRQEVKVRSRNAKISLLSEKGLPEEDLLPIENLFEKKINLLTIVKSLPDMFFLLKDINCTPLLSHGNVTIKINEICNNKGDVTGRKSDYNFFIDDIDQKQKKTLINHYKSNQKNLSIQADLPNNVHLKFSISSNLTTPPVTVYIPEITENISGKKFFIHNPEEHLTEPAAHMMILYCFGMLCRYHPDIWVQAINKNSMINEMTNSLLDIIYRKFPNLIIDQLTGIKHHFQIN